MNSRKVILMTSKLDMVFSALSDPKRRKILEILNHEDSTLLAITSSFDISFQAISKHLKILEQARLITKQKQGKYYVCSYNPETLTTAIDWISKHHKFWQNNFDRLADFLDEPKDKKSSYGWRIKK